MSEHIAPDSEEKVASSLFEDGVSEDTAQQMLDIAISGVAAGGGGAHAVKELNDQLIGIAETPPKQARESVARAVLKVLESSDVKNAVDPKGDTPRGYAVAALLALGYPYALKLHPDDLAFYRARANPPLFRWRVVLALLAFAAVSIGGLVAFTSANVPLSLRPVATTRPLSSRFSASRQSLFFRQGDVLTLRSAWPHLLTQLPRDTSVPVMLTRHTLSYDAQYLDEALQNGDFETAKLLVSTCSGAGCDEYRVIVPIVTGDRPAAFEAFERYRISSGAKPQFIDAFGRLLGP